MWICGAGEEHAGSLDSRQARATGVEPALRGGRQSEEDPGCAVLSSVRLTGT